MLPWAEATSKKSTSPDTSSSAASRRTLCRVPALRWGSAPRGARGSVSSLSGLVEWPAPWLGCWAAFLEPASSAHARLCALAQSPTPLASLFLISEMSAITQQPLTEDRLCVGLNGVCEGRAFTSVRVTWWTQSTGISPFSTRPGWGYRSCRVHDSGTSGPSTWTLSLHQLLLCITASWGST